MTKYTATFADGTVITRKSARGYAVAWRATWDEKDGQRLSETGFSVSKENAEQSAKPYLPWEVTRGQSAKARAFANEQNAKFLKNCNLRVEIVQVTAA